MWSVSQCWLSNRITALKKIFLTLRFHVQPIAPQVWCCLFRKSAMSEHISLSEPSRFHRRLAHFNAARISPTVPSRHWKGDLQEDLQCCFAEGGFLETLRAEVVPLTRKWHDTASFLSWFEELVDNGPGQHHALLDWLESYATLEQMRWFLKQEAAAEAGFEDLLAYTQVRLPIRAKLECARNFWDEMGHGRESAAHGRLLERMVKELDLRPAINTTVWESLALSNTMVGLAFNRRYAFHAIGTLGIIELTAPGRVKKIAAGMKRLGLDGRTRAYYDLHAVLDGSHSRAWLREIIGPLVEADAGCKRHIAEGALMRLVCSERCFDRYYTEMLEEKMTQVC